MEIPGPQGPLPVRRDALGYPSVRAADLEQGMFALGYLHATDRLVQVTVGALASQGRLMSVFGDVPLARLVDRGVRAVGLGNDLEAQVALIDADSRRLLEAYCKGFNAAVERRRRPLALRLLGIQPVECSPAVMLAFFRFFTYFGLTSMQLSTELIVAELAARGAPARLFQRLLGADARGLQLDDLRQLRVPPEFSFFSAASFGSPMAASNAFAVGGSRSKSGGALLMGEFHLEVGRFPPILYATHLAFDDGNFMSGMTIPGLAWFAAGRTRHVGWSYTFAHADNVDFIVERVKDGQYRVGDEERPLRRREERVAIKGKPDETWVFHDNDYGTVLGDVQGAADLPCVRVSGLSEAHRTFSAGARLLDCRNIDDLAAIQREIRNVSLEAILADAHGDVGSVVTGQIDRRPEDWTGAYPRRGWDLFERPPAIVPEAERPICLRPSSGVIVSANQGGHGPYRDRWCTSPEPHYRFDRINELLAGREQHDMQTLARISYDMHDPSVARLLPVWLPLLPDHPLAHRLRSLLEDQRDRTLLRLFHKLHEEASFGLIAEDIGDAAARRMREWSAVAFFQQELDALLALEVPERLGRAELQAILQGAWRRAVAGYPRHDVPVTLRFKHPLTQGRAPAVLGFDSAPIELPGTPVTPFQCRRSPIAGQDLIYAPAFHLVFDMSGPHAWYNMPGGASESRFGPGYGKGIPDWLRGKLLPLGEPDLPPIEA